MSRPSRLSVRYVALFLVLAAGSSPDLVGRPPGRASKSPEPTAEPESEAAEASQRGDAQRTNFNLLGKTASESGDSRRNEDGPSSCFLHESSNGSTNSEHGTVVTNRCQRASSEARIGTLVTSDREDSGYDWDEQSAPVAQLDRALASGARGRRFESCRAYHPCCRQGDLTSLVRPRHRGYVEPIATASSRRPLHGSVSGCTAGSVREDSPTQHRRPPLPRPEAHLFLPHQC